MPRRSALDQPRDEEGLRQCVGMLEAENQRLHQRLKEMTTELARMKGQVPQKQLELELQVLQEQLNRAKAREFGTSSERKKRPASTKSGNEEKPRQGHGPKQQPRLAIVEAEYGLSESELACPTCDKQMSEMGDCSEDSEMINIIRREFIVEQVRRKKYRCQCNAAVVTAKGPPRARKGGRYSLLFACHVAVQKYAYGLPLERQRKMMANDGLDVTVPALYDQIYSVAQELKATYLALREYIVSQSVVGADETPWRLLCNDKPAGTRGAGSQKWWAWILTCPTASWFKLAPSRSAEVAEATLRGLEGTAVVDRYSGYGKAANKLRTVKLANCWSHLRRKFIEAEDGYPEQAAQALSLVDELFSIEREFAVPNDQPESERQKALSKLAEARASRPQKVVDELFAWIPKQHAAPRTSIFRALNYAVKGELGFRCFLADPNIPIHNNASERGVRNLVVGRKTHYGSKSEASAEVAAIYYSLLDSAKLVGVDPDEYLKAAVLFARDGEVLLPHDFAAR